MPDGGRRIESASTATAAVENLWDMLLLAANITTVQVPHHTSMQQRVNQLLKVRDITPAQLAHALQVKEDAVQGWLSKAFEIDQEKSIIVPTREAATKQLGHAIAEATAAEEKIWSAFVKGTGGRDPFSFAVPLQNRVRMALAHLKITLGMLGKTAETAKTLLHIDTNELRRHPECYGNLEEAALALGTTIKMLVSARSEDSAVQSDQPAQPNAQSVPKQEERVEKLLNIVFPYESDTARYRGRTIAQTVERICEGAGIPIVIDRERKKVDVSALAQVLGFTPKQIHGWIHGAAKVGNDTAIDVLGTQLQKARFAMEDRLNFAEGDDDNALWKLIGNVKHEGQSPYVGKWFDEQEEERAKRAREANASNPQQAGDQVAADQNPVETEQTQSEEKSSQPEGTTPRAVPRIVQHRDLAFTQLHRRITRSGLEEAVPEAIKLKQTVTPVSTQPAAEKPRLQPPAPTNSQLPPLSPQQRNRMRAGSLAAWAKSLQLNAEELSKRWKIYDTDEAQAFLEGKVIPSELGIKLIEEAEALFSRISAHKLKVMAKDQERRCESVNKERKREASGRG